MLLAAKIPPELHEAIVGRAAGGESTRAVAAWLKATHGIDVSHVQIFRLLQKHRDHRGEVARHVAATRVERTLEKDLDSYQRRIERLGNAVDVVLTMVEKSPTSVAIDGLAKLWPHYQRAHESQQKVLGIDAGDSLLQSLDELLARA